MLFKPRKCHYDVVSCLYDALGGEPVVGVDDVEVRAHEVLLHACVRARIRV
jgi:hypothetical protein